MKTILLISALFLITSCGKSGGKNSSSETSKNQAQPLFSVLMVSGFKTVYENGQIIKSMTNDSMVELSARRPVYKLAMAQETLNTAADLYDYVESNKATLPVCDFQPATYTCTSLVQKDWREFTLQNNVYDNYNYFQ